MTDKHPLCHLVTGLQRLKWLGGGGQDEEQKNSDSSWAQQQGTDLSFQFLWKTWKKPLAFWNPPQVHPGVRCKNLQERQAEEILISLTQELGLGGCCVI